MTPFETELEKINITLVIWENCKAQYSLTPELIEEGQKILEEVRGKDNK